LTPFSIPTTWEGFVIQNGNPSPEFKKGSVIYSDNDSRIIAVLYKYNSETKQGLMIGIQEVKKQWGGYEKEVPGLPVVPNRESAKNDLSGAEHSESILSSFGNQCMDFSQPDYPYRTSSHAGNRLAWAYCFGNGYFHPALKYVNYQVSAIHSFTSPEQPNGIYAAGGGAFLVRNGILENCIVKNNISSSKGGGVYVGSDSLLVNCVVEENNAPEGKEIYYEPSTGIIPPLANENTKIEIYPNPVKAGNRITVSRNEKEGSYQLFHAATGRIISKGMFRLGDNTIPAPDQQGIYVLQVRSGNKSYQTKLIVN
jgi:hypothetical protein